MVSSDSKELWCKFISVCRHYFLKLLIWAIQVLFTERRWSQKSISQLLSYFVQVGVCNSSMAYKPVFTQSTEKKRWNLSVVSAVFVSIYSILEATKPFEMNFMFDEVLPWFWHRFYQLLECSICSLYDARLRMTPEAFHRMDLTMELRSENYFHRVADSQFSKLVDLS
jgi:hypothetical protein